MDPIPKENMGNATSLFNLVRNLGGSIGISVVSTLQQRLLQGNIHALGANVNSLSPEAQSSFYSLKSMFFARTGDAALASKQALAALFGMVERQASMIAYNDVFLLLCVLFLLMLPFLLLMRRPAHTRGPAATH
jgi:DHA2 family multidrug resistance protein